MESLLPWNEIFSEKSADNFSVKIYLIIFQKNRILRKATFKMFCSFITFMVFDNIFGEFSFTVFHPFRYFPWPMLST